MKALQIMSIVGIILAALCFLVICWTIDSDVNTAAGWGVWATLYLLAISIVSCVFSYKYQKEYKK